jgi:fatty-acyl-CoA synthase
MNSTMQDRPLTIAAIVRHAAAVHSSAEVITTTAAATRRSTFGEVIEQASRLAGGLRDLGVGPGDRVGTLCWNNTEHLEAYLAVPGIGAVLHTLNVRLATGEIAFIAGHAGDSVLIVAGNLVERCAALLPALPAVHTVVVTGPGDLSPLAGSGKRIVRYDDLADRGSPAGWEHDWEHEPPEQAAAVMCHTSGTTGQPKGVVYSHRSTVLHAMSVCSANAVGLSASDRALLLVPMFHANAWGWPFAALMAGTSIVLTDDDLSPAHIARVIAAERITVTGGVPTIWHDLLAHLDTSPGAEPGDLSSLRLILCGGSAVPQPLIDAYRAAFGVAIVPAWGMTETSPLGSVAWPLAGPGGELAEVQRSQGRILFGLEARIVGDDGEAAPRDGVTPGEFQVRGPWVTGQYYLGDSPGSFTADGWLRTGDIGSLDQHGYLRLTDRAKDVIKSGGEWISSLALEDAIAGHPAIAQVAVIAAPDERWQERPLAVVVTAEGADLSAGELRAWLAGQVPRWWVPERWAVVSGLPRTSVGKFDKKLLRQQLADGELDIRGP